jgi:hypothetical protein
MSTNNPTPLAVPKLLNPSHFEFEFFIVERKHLVDYVLEFSTLEFQSSHDRFPTGIEYYQADSTLSPIVKGYDLGATRMSFELAVSEDFHERTQWLLDYSATAQHALVFKINLLNSEQRPVLYHQGIALHCELDTFAHGYRTEEIPTKFTGGFEDGAISLEYGAAQMTASIAFTQLQQVKFYQKF